MDRMKLVILTMIKKIEHNIEAISKKYSAKWDHISGILGDKNFLHLFKVLYTLTSDQFSTSYGGITYERVFRPRGHNEDLDPCTFIDNYMEPTGRALNWLISLCNNALPSIDEKDDEEVVSESDDEQDVVPESDDEQEVDHATQQIDPNSQTNNEHEVPKISNSDINDPEIRIAADYLIHLPKSYQCEWMPIALYLLGNLFCHDVRYFGLRKLCLDEVRNGMKYLLNRFVVFWLTSNSDKSNSNARKTFMKTVLSQLVSNEKVKWNDFHAPTEKKSSAAKRIDMTFQTKERLEQAKFLLIRYNETLLDTRKSLTKTLYNHIHLQRIVPTNRENASVLANWKDYKNQWPVAKSGTVNKLGNMTLCMSKFNDSVNNAKDIRKRIHYLRKDRKFFALTPNMLADRVEDVKVRPVIWTQQEAKERQQEIVGELKKIFMLQ